MCDASQVPHGIVQLIQRSRRVDIVLMEFLSLVYNKHMRTQRAGKRGSAKRESWRDDGYSLGTGEFAIGSHQNAAQHENMIRKVTWM